MKNTLGSEPMRAVLSFVPSEPSGTDHILDIPTRYHYPRVVSALTDAGLETVLAEGWPAAIEEDFLLFHTMSIDHQPVSGLGTRYGDDIAARAVPVQTSLPGALHSVLIAGAPAAVENEGYARWVEGTDRQGTASGLIVTVELARRAALTILKTFGDAAVIDNARPLPHLLVQALKQQAHS